MISITLLIIYCLGLYLIFLFFNADVTVLTLLSVFIGYLYATHIEPWIYGIKLDIKELNKESKRLKGHSLISIAITTGFVFATIVAALMYTGNVLSSDMTNEFQSILIQTVFAMLSLMMIPAAIVIVFIRINNRIDTIHKSTKWEEVPDDRERSEDS